MLSVGKAPYLTRLLFKVVLGRVDLFSPAIFNIFINAFIVKLRETNSGCCINDEFVGCVMYADDIILISASVNCFQTLLNCSHTVSLDLLLKFNCVKSTFIAIGLRSSFNISNMQLGSDLIS